MHNRGMLRLTLLLVAATLLPAASPFAGRWNFTQTAPNGTTRGTWLGITEKNGSLEVWFQPTGGNVYQLTDVVLKNKRLVLTLGKTTDKAPRPVIELEAAGDKLIGTLVRGTNSQPLLGLRAPALNRPMPKAWAAPVPLFNGKDLNGWEPMGKPEDSHWKVEGGLLVNTDHGANLKTTGKYNDFKLHFEVLCPDHANSGFYLRGRYEIQLEYEPLSSNPPERRIGSIYGRIAPNGDIARKPGEWDVWDVTFVGRTVTIVRNGVTTINKQEIEGITGGAMDANESEPGPFYIQGDHTGGLKFRNITISVPKQ